MHRSRRGSPRASEPPAALGDLLRDAHRAVAARSDLAIDSQLWTTSVGPRIARAAKPGRLRDGVLTVHVASASWAQELSLLSNQIAQRLRARGLRVRRLVFQVTPAARSATGTGTRRTARPEQPLPALPDDLKQRLERVPDAELAGEIAEAARHSLALDERRQKRAKRATSPAARGPRSDASGSDRPDRSGPAPRGAPRRTR